MSQADVSAVRRAYEVFNTGDLAAWLELFDPRIVWHASEDNPDVDTYHGHEGLAALFLTWREMFEELRVEPHEFIDAGDMVIVPARVRGRGTGSGAEIDMPSTWTWKLHAGKTIEAWEHRTKEQALEAAGLRV
jgi:ketosteroid isomerase-like protein